MVGSQMDEIIYLCHESTARRLPPPVDGVRHVIFGHPDEVPALLGAHPAFVFDLKPTTVGDSSEEASFQGLGEDGAHHQEETAPPNLDQMPSEINHSADAGALGTLSGVTRPPDDDVAALSELHIDAAKKIDRIYHSVLMHRREGPRSVLSEARYRLFLECRAISEQMEWSSRGYCLLFLGPLPHVLLCLEQAKTCAFQLKAKLKKRLLSSEHFELEDLQLKMTRIK